MGQRERSPQKMALRRCFNQWVDIVELFARRRRARKRIDPEAYVALQRELIRSCRALAASANEVEAAFYRYIEDLAQPWLDLAVLSKGERDILFDLVIRCRHVRTQLGGRSWIRSLMPWGVPVVAAALIFAIMLLCMGRFSVILSTILDRARGWSDDLWFRITRSSDVERLFVVGCILVVVSMVLVTRTARS
jgi:hypothetical protein